MVAVDPPAIVAPAPDQNQPDVIEVIGTRSGQAQKIDRRTYAVQENPHSAQKDAVQLLRGLPAVTVTPDGGVMLLGSGDVRIFVNGRPYQGDLHTLHGSDIERVEIITNPSAQYSTEGSGGIINLVLKHKQGEGLSGSASADVARPGSGTADATIKYKKGKWIYEAEVQGGAGRPRHLPYDRRRSVEASVGASPTVDDESGRQSSGIDSAEANGKVTYEVDSRTSISAKLEGGDYRTSSITTSDFVGLTPDFQSFSARQRRTSAGSFVVGQLDFDHKGAKQGETLTAEINIFGRPKSHGASSAAFSNGGALSTESRNGFFGWSGQLDWQHVMGRHILSVGGSVSHREASEHYRVAESGPWGAREIDMADQFRGVDDIAAIYATFQQPIGSWTVMPGLRVEGHNLSISSPGLPDIKLDHVQAFPTFHAERRFGKTVDLTVSYSKRIDRAQTDMVRPYREVQDVVTSVQGNPHLKDQSTDAYELNLHYHRKTVDAGLILYDRETSRLWARNYEVVDGVGIYRTINSGHRRSRGAEFDLGTPIVKRVKLNASVNLFDERTPVDATGGTTTEDSFRYTTNATLEWVGPDRGKIPGDVAQLQWGYNSPTRQFLLRNFASSSLSLSGTHNFSRPLSLTGTISYTTNTRNRLLAPLVREDYRLRSPVDFKLKLLKTFGKR